MSILSAVNQSRLEETLVKDGYFSQEDFNNLKLEAEKVKVPLLTYLVNQQKISGEIVTKILAKVNKIP